MKNGKWLVALGFAAAAAAGPAAAQDPGLYAGGSVGYAAYKDSCKDLVVPCDGEDTAWRAFGGYQFNRWFAVEFGYADLGEAEGAGILNTGNPGSFKIEWKEAFDLTAVFLAPVTERLSLLGRAGMYRARTTTEVQDTTGPLASPGGTNSGFSYGAGVEFRLGALGVRAEWQRWENVGTSSTGEDDIDMLSVGVLFRF
jgi:OOP family OmpA-OmpF porin